MFKKFCSYYKPHWKLFVLDLFCAVLLALCNLAYPYIVQDIMKIYIHDSLAKVIFWSLALLGIYIIKCILNFILQYWGHIVGVRIQSDMRKEIFGHLQKLPFSYYDENKTGTIMSRIINDLMDIAELAHHGPEDILISSITLTGACILMSIRVDWRLSLIVFAAIPFVVLYAIVTRKGMRNAFKRMREETGRINSSVESSVSGIRVSKAYTAADHENERFEYANSEFRKARANSYKYMGIFSSGMQFLMDVLYLIAILVGGIFTFNKIITVDAYAAYILYITTIIGPIRTLVAIYEQIQNGSTGFKRFQEVINTAPEYEKPNAVELKDIKTSIAFENVSFSYNPENDETRKEVLHNLNLTIPVGKTLALVGPSGGGKTTICHLIPRFYSVTSGKITIDGVDICDYTINSLRGKIGIVSQDVFLFGGTVKDNIAYGDFNASDEEIIEAAKKANIHEFIMSLENGYDTYVGERGVKLSGGQKQRISIARAFLKNPPILILDEATSALDNMTEMQIQASLEKLSKGRTTIVVAHRLSTVKNADEIIVISDIGIEERGSHQELIEQNGVYANLYQYQFKE